MGTLTEASGQEHLLLLTGGIVLHGLFKLRPGEVQLAQNGFEEALLQPLCRDKALEASPQPGRILGHHGANDAAAHGDGAGMRRGGLQQQSQQAGFAAAVFPGQGNPVSPLQSEGHRLGNCPAMIDRRHVPAGEKPGGMVGHGKELERLRRLGVFEQ